MLHAQGVLSAGVARRRPRICRCGRRSGPRRWMSATRMRCWRAGAMSTGRRFSGLRALWRRGHEIFAEVTAGEGVTVGGFGIHPVVLDAALHALGVAEGGDATMLPFSWQGVCLHAAGASRVRVRHSAGRHRRGVGGAWPMRRACRSCRCASWWFVRSRRRSCRPRWRPPRVAAADCMSRRGPRSPLEDNAVAADGLAVWEPSSGAGGAVGSVYAATHEALGVLQSWLAGERRRACWWC